MIRVSMIPIMANTRGVDLLWSVEYLYHILPFNRQISRRGGHLSRTRLRQSAGSNDQP